MINKIFLLSSRHCHWIMRIVVSFIFFVHGFPKLGQEVASLGLIGYLVGPFEVLGAFLLIVGPIIELNMTRLGALLIFIIMVGAIYMHIMKWGDSIYDVEFQMTLLSISLFFLIRGDIDEK